jgi:uncharacterized RDD family membrane protein YckC
MFKRKNHQITKESTERELNTANEILAKITKNDSIAIIGANNNDNNSQINNNPNSANLWRRISAKVIDWLIFGIIGTVIFFCGFIIFISLNSDSITDQTISLCQIEYLKSDLTANLDTQICVDYIYKVQITAIFIIATIIALYIGYNIIMSRYGQTFGKRIMKIKIISNSSNIQLTWLQLFSRELFTIISLCVILTGTVSLKNATDLNAIVNVLFLIDLGSILFTEKKQAWHDTIAQTWVVQK